MTSSKFWNQETQIVLIFLFYYLALIEQSLNSFHLVNTHIISLIFSGRKEHVFNFIVLRHSSFFLMLSYKVWRATLNKLFKQSSCLSSKTVSRVETFIFGPQLLLTFTAYCNVSLMCTSDVSISFLVTAKGHDLKLNHNLNLLWSKNYLNWRYC